MAELRKLSLPELRKRMRDLKSEHFEMRFERISGKLENYRRLRELRREIARVKTLITEMEMRI
ncbi:50S ribosomal protein L29 [bacterium]|nr:50S ribosomal protein L29 [bacterium]